MRRLIIAAIFAGIPAIGAELPAWLSPEDRATLQPATAPSRVIGVNRVSAGDQPSIHIVPVTVNDILQVLTAGQHGAGELRALVERASGSTIQQAIAAVVNDPAQCQVLLYAIPVNKRVEILTGLADAQAVLNPAVGAVFTAMLANIVTQPAQGGAGLTVLARVVRADPKLEVTVFVLDLARWIQVQQVLGVDVAIYGGNWLGVARSRLRNRIDREGYSDGVMAEFQQIKTQLSRPVNNTSKGSDSTGYR